MFRLLMRFAPRAVRSTEIAEALRLKQNTPSHHLADLTASGPVQVERQGRSLFYSRFRPCPSPVHAPRAAGHRTL